MEELPFYQTQRNQAIITMLRRTGVKLVESGGFVFGTVSNSDGLILELLLFPDSGLTVYRKKHPVKELILQGLIADAPTFCQLFMDMVWIKHFPEWHQSLFDWQSELIAISQISNPPKS